MRVLHICQPDDGGVPEHVRNLSRAQSAAGLEVVTLGPASLSGSSPALEPRHIDWLAGRPPSPDDARQLRAARTIIGEEQPDLVHAHSAKAGGIARLAAGTTPVVYTPHCLAFLAGFSRSQRAIYLMLERALAPRTAAYIFPSHWERLKAMTWLSLPPAKARYVPYGVDAALEPLPQTDLVAFKRDRKLLTMVSALRPQKDPLTLVSAVSRLNEGARKRLAVAIVGNGELAPAVCAAIKTARLEDSVRHFPFQAHQSEYLAASNAFVLPSKWESLPISVLEALAAGTPVLATAVSGTPEAVFDGENGYLFPAADPAALARLLERVADGRIDLTKLLPLRGGRGPATVEEMHRRTLGVYRAVLG